MAAPSKIDYSFFNADWAAGIKTTRQMAAEYNAEFGTKVSHESIRKYFTSLGVERDLTARIKAKAQAMVDKAMVDKIQATVDKATEKATIEVAARNQADIILAHRKSIPRYQKLAEALLLEIEAQTASPELFEQLGELLHAPDDKGVDKLNELYRKVIGSPQRVDSLKKLVETYKNLVGLERQAFGLSDNANGEADKPPAQAISDLEAARRIAFALARAEKAK